jgi:hypothetical protein
LTTAADRAAPGRRRIAGGVAAHADFGGADLTEAIAGAAIAVALAGAAVRLTAELGGADVVGALVRAALAAVFARLVVVATAVRFPAGLVLVDTAAMTQFFSGRTRPALGDRRAAVGGGRAAR